MATASVTFTADKAGRLLVLLLLVLPRHAHGDEGPHVRRAEIGLIGSDTVRLPSRMLPAALVAAGLSGFASAETLTAVPGQPLQALLDRAARRRRRRTCVRRAYNGSIRIDRPLVLTGRPGRRARRRRRRQRRHGNRARCHRPRPDRPGVRARPAGDEFRHLSRRRPPSARRSRTTAWLETCSASTCTAPRDRGSPHNVIEGLRGGRLSEAGNGVSLWNAPDVTIADNTFRYGRDGIFTISSRKDRFVGNRFEQVRFAVHYMYTNDSEVSGNVSVGNHRRLRHHVLEPA